MTVEEILAKLIAFPSAVFRIENGAFVIDATAADERQLRDVCAACPSGALTIEEA